MTGIHQVDSLAIEQDRPYQQRTWVVERVVLERSGGISIMHSTPGRAMDSAPES